MDANRIETLSRELRSWLNGVRLAVADEIRSYPKPIPRCDAQFNHLIERREHLSRLLTDLDIVLDRRDGGDALRNVLAQLSELLSFGDSIEERRLRERIGAELDRT